MIRSQLDRFAATIKASHKRQPVLFWIRVAIVAVVIALFSVQRSIWTPDTLFLILLALFVVLGQARTFIIRFAPFLLLLLTYDSFRAIADDLNNNVHFWEMIHVDIWMFGGLPTAVLQDWWWHGYLQWYDFYFYFLYTIHFLAPVLLAVLFWKLRPNLYWPFVWGLVGLSFAAFVTYVVFPAAPPWMASDLGYIEPIHRISSDVWYAMGVTDFSKVYSELSPNPVAAVPSLHSAYPMLFALFLVKAFGWRRMGWVYVYPVSMWVGVTYLGEHYVIDAILGALYAVIAYFVAIQFFNYGRKQSWWDFEAQYNRGHDKATTWVHSRRYKS
ncbi:MAG TPA: phosphatase PAP2 family protein [Candidatus Saccharimonadales bacterium]|nr:phosphatase PAP2 family protein [Candidatus Saccharimonadales bacterium]